MKFRILSLPFMFFIVGCIVTSVYYGQVVAAKQDKIEKLKVEMLSLQKGISILRSSSSQSKPDTHISNDVEDVAETAAVHIEAAQTAPEQFTSSDKPSTPIDSGLPLFDTSAELVIAEGPDVILESTEFQKEMAKIELKQSISEISKTLDLTDEQETELEDLLTLKSNQEFESLNPMFEEIMKSDQMQVLSEAEFNEKMELASQAQNKIQQEFLDGASALLSSEQMEKYQSLEVMKAKMKFEKQSAFFKQEVYALVPQLDEYQKQQINNLYDEISGDEAFSEQVKLGSFGSSHPDNFDNPGSNPLNTFDQRIHQILTPEQLAARNEALEKMFQQN